MYARVNTLPGPRDGVDEVIKNAREKVIPAVRQVPGNAGIISLVDRATGRTIGITLWQNEESLRQSQQAASGIRQETVADAGGSVVSVESFEVTDFVLEGQPAVV